MTVFPVTLSYLGYTLPEQIVPRNIRGGEVQVGQVCSQDAVYFLGERGVLVPSA
jgi:hypothetical protein